MEKQGVKIIEIEVSPQVAAVWLESSKGNRTESNKKISEYAELMRTGQWGFSNDLIVFDVNGVLRNGHHRLMAVVRSGATVRFNVAFNAPESAWVFFDTNKTRDVASMLEIDKGDKIKSARNIAAIGRMSLAYEKYADSVANGDMPPSFAVIVNRIHQKETFDYVCKNYDAIVEAFRFAAQGHRYQTFTTILAVFVYLARKAKADPEKLASFVHKVVTLEELDQLSPVLALRRRLMSMSLNSYIYKCPALLLIMKAYNYYSDGKKVSTLQLNTGFITIQEEK